MNPNRECYRQLMYAAAAVMAGGAVPTVLAPTYLPHELTTMFGRPMPITAFRWVVFWLNGLRLSEKDVSVDRATARIRFPYPLGPEDMLQITFAGHGARAEAAVYARDIQEFLLVDTATGC